MVLIPGSNLFDLSQSCDILYQLQATSLLDPLLDDLLDDYSTSVAKVVPLACPLK